MLLFPQSPDLSLDRRFTSGAPLFLKPSSAARRSYRHAAAIPIVPPVGRIRPHWPSSNLRRELFPSTYRCASSTGTAVACSRNVWNRFTTRPRVSTWKRLSSITPPATVPPTWSPPYFRKRSCAQPQQRGLRTGEQPGGRPGPWPVSILSQQRHPRSPRPPASFDYAQAHPEIGMLGPRMQDGEGKVQISYRPRPTLAALLHHTTLFRCLGLLAAAHRRYRRGELSIPPPHGPWKPSWARLCFCAVTCSRSAADG